MNAGPLDRYPGWCYTHADLYIVQNPAAGRIEIGITRNIATRLSALENGAGTGLILMALLANGARYEGPLHSAYAADRRFGEWFDPSDSLLLLAEKLTESAIEAVLTARVPEWRAWAEQYGRRAEGEQTKRLREREDRLAAFPEDERRRKECRR